MPSLVLSPFRVGSAPPNPPKPSTSNPSHVDPPLSRAGSSHGILSMIPANPCPQGFLPFTRDFPRGLWTTSGTTTYFSRSVAWRGWWRCCVMCPSHYHCALGSQPLMVLVVFNKGCLEKNLYADVLPLVQGPLDPPPPSSGKKWTAWKCCISQATPLDILD